MIQAASQASAFYEQVARSGSVFTLLDDGHFLVFPIGKIEVVPFWSTRSRVEIVQKNHPKYRAWDCDQSGLDVFLERTLPDLEREGIHVGVNWSGARLTGYDLAVADLRKNLAYWRARIGH